MASDRAGRRNVANRHTSRLKLVFKWAAENELVPGTVYHSIAAVSAPRHGRSEARETEPVRPVPDAYIDAVLPFLSRHVKAMVQLQLYTGMRPGEVCQVRTCDVDSGREIWIYKPARHKTKHLGHTREVRVGPQASAILRPFLKTDLQAPVFSPAEAESERHERQRSERKTPLTPSQVRRAELAQHRPRKRPPKAFYTATAYRRAVVRAS